MLLKGEVVTIVTVKGGGFDHNGALIPEVKVNRDLPGCVIVPKGAALQDAGSEQGWLAVKDVHVLAPGFIENVEEQNRVIIRGEEFYVSAPPFHHRSAFGTGRGGTEIPCTRKVGT